MWVPVCLAGELKLLALLAAQLPPYRDDKLWDSVPDYFLACSRDFLVSLLVSSKPVTSLYAKLSAITSSLAYRHRSSIDILMNS